jgi:hypothetical protein
MLPMVNDMRDPASETLAARQGSHNRSHLESRELATCTIKLRLGAVRRSRYRL